MAEPDDGARPWREPSLADAIVPLVLLAGLIGGSLTLFGLDALDGPIQVAVALSAASRDRLVGASSTAPWASAGRSWGRARCTHADLPAVRRLQLRQPGLSVLLGITGFKIEKVQPSRVDT